jgi:hypothetical protein
MDANSHPLDDHEKRLLDQMLARRGRPTVQIQ